MSIKLQIPKLPEMRPRLTVIGVGGAGCNAINNMIAAGLNGVDFIVANTDAQALAASSAEHRVQLGVTLTEGLGAGSKPEIGEAAAEEAIEDLRSQMAGSHMVFIAAGMGGGTGTGAASVIARIARELGVLTVGIVTKPFHFEGTRRMRIADIGVAELKKYVDTLIVIPNQNLFRVANERTTFAEAFVLADQVLYSGVACIVDLIIKEGLINLDFADVRTVMSGMGTAMMGIGEASGERRAIMAAEEAIANPLLDDVTLRGARGLLLSISGGRNLTLYEVDEAASRVRQEVDPEANIIVGATFDESLGDRIRVSIVASGMMRQGDAGREQVRAESAPMVAAPVPHVMPPMPRSDPTRAATHAPQRQTGSLEDPAENKEVYRRLSAALQEPSADSFAAVQWPQTPPRQAPGEGPTKSESADNGNAKNGREMWQAPGSVLIEEAPPPLQRRLDPAPPSGPSPQREPFTPELAAQIRRPQRRMPEVDDFPVVAQREYRAKAPGSAPASDRPAANRADARRPDTDRPEPPARRPGLLERFARRGWRTDDSHTIATPPAQTARNPRNSPPGSARARAATGGGWNATGDAEINDQTAELPELFSRDRK